MICCSSVLSKGNCTPGVEVAVAPVCQIQGPCHSPCFGNPLDPRLNGQFDPAHSQAIDRSAIETGIASLSKKKPEASHARIARFRQNEMTRVSKQLEPRKRKVRCGWVSESAIASAARRSYLASSRARKLILEIRSHLRFLLLCWWRQEWSHCQLN
jgi:hypothetical protein